MKFLKVGELMKAINIGKRTEPFWDTYLIDTEKTTAKPCVNHPEFCDTLFEFDKNFDKTGGELFTISYPILVNAENCYRLYYHPQRPRDGWKLRGGDFAQTLLCVLESKDGIHWNRPSLTNFKDRYKKPNNIVFDETNDGIFVFYDKNPACPEEEKFKALGCRVKRDENGKLIRRWLHCYTSPDGYTFNEGYPIHEGDPNKEFPEYDSLNIALWNNEKYVLYYRFNEKAEGKPLRTVRYAYSDDFHNWEEAGSLTYNDNKSYQMYTNQVMQYERAPHIFVALPTRYVERCAWTPNMENMASYQLKKAASDFDLPYSAREGLAVTDCLFMCSRDGENWNRYCEAFMTPGIETDSNWVYGDCYPCYGLLDIGDENYYFYTIDNHMNYNEKKLLNRWKIRKDGFAYYCADYNGGILVTKPIIYSGAKLHLNFETSAFGSIYVDILDSDGNEIDRKTSFEIFGNSLDRPVFFADGSDFSEYEGKIVRLRFRMQDAKLYSMYFGE